MDFFTFIYRNITCLNILLFLLVVQLEKSICFDQDLTITVDPGREECFYQTVIIGQIIDIEFQVIDGGSGNLDVHFGLYSPKGAPIVVDFKKTDAVHRHEAKEDGDYRVCFDNTFSRFSAKVVYFALMLDSGEDDDDDDDEDKDDVDNDVVRGVPKTSEAYEIYEMTVEDIQEKMTIVRHNLLRVKHLQEQLRAFEARDRNLQERNFDIVNSWSLLQLAVMLCVGFVQVIMLRSLFDDRSRVRKIWKFAKF